MKGREAEEQKGIVPSGEFGLPKLPTYRYRAYGLHLGAEPHLVQLSWESVQSA